MKPAFNPRVIDRRQPKGPGTKSVLPRYVMVDQSKRVHSTIEVYEGVFVDLDADGNRIGVEVI